MASTVVNLDGRAEARTLSGELIRRIIEMIKILVDMCVFEIHGDDLGRVPGIIFCKFCCDRF